MDIIQSVESPQNPFKEEAEKYIKSSEKRNISPEQMFIDMRGISDGALSSEAKGIAGEIIVNRLVDKAFGSTVNFRDGGKAVIDGLGVEDEELLGRLYKEGKDRVERNNEENRKKLKNMESEELANHFFSQYCSDGNLDKVLGVLEEEVKKPDSVISEEVAKLVKDKVEEKREEIKTKNEEENIKEAKKFIEYYQRQSGNKTIEEVMNEIPEEKLSVGVREKVLEIMNEETE